MNFYTCPAIIYKLEVNIASDCNQSCLKNG